MLVENMKLLLHMLARLYEPPNEASVWGTHLVSLELPLIIILLDGRLVG